MSDRSHQFLCVHGHFYQPPRQDPFTHLVPSEYGAAPFANYNEKITAECYLPNAEMGNFERISFNVGPTLAAWLESAHPDVLKTIIAADQRSLTEHGAGAALAQAYNHTILPLASARDKRTQIIWGLLDFERRFEVKCNHGRVGLRALRFESDLGRRVHLAPRGRSAPRSSASERIATSAG